MTTLEELNFRMRRIAERHELERRRARFRPDGKFRPAHSRNEFITKEALVREPLDNGKAELWITYNGMRESALRLRQDPELVEALQHTAELLDPDALNGYVAFNKRHAPRLPGNYRNIVQYIPVHGGITYMVKDSYAAVWGFDTQHAGSETQPRTDRDWIRAHCYILYRGLRMAETMWPEFRRASQQRRAEMAQQLLDLLPESALIDKLGFPALIGLMMGGRVG